MRRGRGPQRPSQQHAQPQPGHDRRLRVRASRVSDDAEKKTILALVLAVQVDFVMGNHVYKVGDTIYLQTDGGPMGLKLTGAIARVVMMLFDKLYLEKVSQSDIRMLMYERCVILLL